MIDIKTDNTSSASTPILPFDWRSLVLSKSASSPQHDYSNPCAPPVHGAVVLKEYGLVLDATLHTAVILSLFCDRRAGRDVVLPLNQTDRRGWCGDEFVRSSDAWGSTLWLFYVTKSTADVLESARFAAWEALQWMVRDGVASKIDVDAQWAGESQDQLTLRPQIWHFNNDTSPVYDVLWGTTLRKTL